MAKIQFLTILLTVTCFLDSVVSVTDKEFEDLVSFVHRQEAMLEEHSTAFKEQLIRNEQQAALIESLREENRQALQRLQMTDVQLDARVTAIEENDGGNMQNETIAFNAIVTSYSNIFDERAIPFDLVLLNEGDGYNSETGTFTVPPGGDGYYYFSTYLTGPGGEYGFFHIRINEGDDLCGVVVEQLENSGDYLQSSCGTVTYAAQGDMVQVVYSGGFDRTPLWETGNYWSGFTGFRI